MGKIELFVIYTGNKIIGKDIISLNELFYGNKGNVDLKVKVISKENVSKIFSKKNIVSEYIKFADISTKYEKEYGRSKETAIKVIDECINEDILKEFMVEHKKEVIGIMDVLYDENVVMESYENELRQEGMQQGMQQILVRQYKDKKISEQEGAKYLNISVQEFLELVK